MDMSSYTEPTSIKSTVIMVSGVVSVCLAIAFIAYKFINRGKPTNSDGSLSIQAESSHNGGSSKSESNSNTQNVHSKQADTPESLLKKANTLDEAIETTVRFMEDGPEFSRGTNLLASWGISELKWRELNALKSTKYSLAKKDIKESRGKLLCLSGSVFEIEVEDIGDKKIARGGMLDGDGDVLRFIAIKSSGEIVKGTYARFCGVVTEKQSYANSGGGMTHALAAVGMFDLPENKK